MASVLKFLGYAYRDVGDYDKSSVYFERLAVLRDSLKCREQESAAQDYAALYDSKEKDRQILQEQQESRTAWTIAGGISVLLDDSGRHQRVAHCQWHLHRGHHPQEPGHQ